MPNVISESSVQMLKNLLQNVTTRTINIKMQRNINTVNATILSHSSQNYTASGKSVTPSITGGQMNLTTQRALTRLNKTSLAIQPSANTSHINITEFCNAPEPGKHLTMCLLEAIHSVPDEDLPQAMRILNPSFPLTIHEELLEILDVFAQEMTSHNLTYFIAGGTLIGSWRHHGFIPWDDDADVYMHVKDKQRVKVNFLL